MKLKTLTLGLSILLFFPVVHAANDANVQACLNANQDIIANSQNNDNNLKTAKAYLGANCFNTTIPATAWPCIDQEVSKNGMVYGMAIPKCTNQVQ